MSFTIKAGGLECSECRAITKMPRIINHALGCSERKGFGGLSAREKEVAIIRAHGKRIKDIANDLDITPKTVQVHMANLYLKLGINNASDLTRIVIEWEACQSKES